MDLETILQEAIDELARAGVDRRHPFRFLTFCTNNHGQPDARMVVMRSFHRQPSSCSIYTDSRSNKVQQLMDSQQKALLLFWHPKKRWQLKAKVHCHFQTDEAKSYFLNLPEAGQASYNTHLPPSSAAASLSEANQLREAYTADNFLYIQCAFEELEVLRLKNERHERATYSFGSDGKIEEMSWLVP